MPAIVKRLTNDGLRNVDYRADSLDSAAEFEARDGVYTVSNTYHVTQTLLCWTRILTGWRIPPDVKDSFSNAIAQDCDQRCARWSSTRDSEMSDFAFRLPLKRPRHFS